MGIEMDSTLGVFRAAYIIAVIVYGGYALTIWIRAKRIRERLAEARRYAGDRANGHAR